MGRRALGHALAAAIEQMQCWLLAVDPLLIEAMTIIVSGISAIMISPSWAALLGG